MIKRPNLREQLSERDRIILSQFEEKFKNKLELEEIGAIKFYFKPFLTLLVNDNIENRKIMAQILLQLIEKL